MSAYAELRAAYLPPMAPRLAGVAALLIDGMAPTRIAPAMGLSLNQVHDAISRLCRMLQCQRRTLCRRLRELVETRPAPAVEGAR